MRYTAAILLVAGAMFALPTGGIAASRGRVCGTLRASVPYTHNGTAKRWRVYVAGNTTCGAAEATLDAVMHLRATLHQGASEASTYLTYRGWSCPAGQMGVQECLKPHRTPPYAAQALALDCSEVQCPTRHAPAWFPELSALPARTSR